MKHLYPNEIAHEVKTRWINFQKVFKNRKNPSFPSDEHLQSILDVIYHSSFTTEELRKTAVRIAYVLPKDTQGKDNFLNTYDPPIKLSEVISYNVGELLKITPAFSPNYSIIVVAPNNDVSPIKSEDNSLVIWGIMNIGQDYFNLINGKSSAAFALPNFLVIGVTAPGFLTMSTMGRVLLKIRNGQLVFPSINELSESAVGKHLADSAAQLYGDICKKLNTKVYSNDDSNEHPYQVYYRTIANIMRQTREHFHGGTFIIVPNELTIEDERLKDRINLKYKIQPLSIWDELVKEAVSNKKYFDKVFKKSITLSELKENGKQDTIREGAEQKIFEYEFFVSKLSSVDGAVLLNQRLDILGFGGEITASSSSLQIVRKAHDAYGNKWTEVSIQSFGTRHRSALRFCSSYENACAFVISQDGSAKAIKRVGSHVYMWDDITISNHGY